VSIIPWKNKTSEEPATRESSLTEFRSEVNRLFDSFLREPIGTLSDSLTAWNRWGPALDVSQSDTTVTVQAELPGVDPNEIDVTVTGDRLTIAGEKKETVEKTNQDIFHRETRYGSFSRTVQLPASVDPQQVSAEYANGVLTINLKKTPNATARKILVSTNAPTATP
jgi:HSP20 family protein